ncbi:hypothetical protein BSIN_0302 [Burkholderia singularis]|uniref:Uncharacterized protein n=1 Tax=Burkholderia singularis TaxID=1503053 RepID=A0A238H4W2_9BURK|nr:hypothetical protein BSIN_0302 [Burkholderia singularis]
MSFLDTACGLTPSDGAPSSRKQISAKAGTSPATHAAGRAQRTSTRRQIRTIAHIKN